MLLAWQPALWSLQRPSLPWLTSEQQPWLPLLVLQVQRLVRQLQVLLLVSLLLLT